MIKKSSKMILTSCLFLSLLSGCTSVAKGTKTYSYEFDYQNVNGGIEITGIQYNQKNKKLDITIPNEILGKKVVSIAKGALKNISAIHNVIMGENVKEIKEEAFSSCENLSSILYPATQEIFVGDRAFEKTALKSLELTNKMKLGNEVYKDCQQIASISSQATQYGERIFAGCTSLNNLTLNFVGSDENTPKTISYLFDEIPSSLKNISIENSKTLLKDTFANLTKVEKIVLPSNRAITTLPLGLFKDCSSLTSIKIPFVGQETYFAENALEEANYSLAYLFGVESNDKIPESLKEVILYPTVSTSGVKYGMSSIRPVNFNNAKTIEKITMDSGLEMIEANAFAGCVALNNITLPSSLQRIGAHAFDDTKYYQDKATTKDTLITLGTWAIGIEMSGNNQKVEISNSLVNSLCDELFMNNANIESVKFANVKKMGTNVFKNATNLKTIDMNVVTTIPESTFEGCTSLTEVILPRVSEIKAMAFKGATALTTISLAKVTSIAQSAFEGCSNLKTITISRYLKKVEKNAFKDTVLTTIELDGNNQTTIDALKALLETTDFEQEGNETLKTLIQNLSLSPVA